MKRYLSIPACAWALTFAAVPRNALAQVPDTVAIRQARLAQNKALAVHDLDKAASYWTDDVVVVAGLGLAFQGSDNYRRAFALDSSVLYERIPDAIVASAWPLAWETGRWTGTRGGNPVISGRYSAMWANVAGRWRIKSELFVALNCSGDACKWPVHK